MGDLDKEALDRHITGNYGEDQFPDWDEGTTQCQVSNCDGDAIDGVLCEKHQPPADIPDWWEGEGNDATMR